MWKPRYEMMSICLILKWSSSKIFFYFLNRIIIGRKNIFLFKSDGFRMRLILLPKKRSENGRTFE